MNTKKQLYIRALLMPLCFIILSCLKHGIKNMNESNNTFTTSFIDFDQLDSSQNSFIKEIKSDKQLYGKCVITNKKGNFVSLGHSSDELVIFEIDRNSDILWENNLGYLNNLTPISLNELKDNSGYLITGHYYNSDKTDIFVIKTDLKGNKKWDANIATQNNDYAIETKSYENGDILIYACLDNSNSISSYIGLINLNSEGKIQSNKTYEIEGFPNQIIDINDKLIISGLFSYESSFITEFNKTSSSPNWFLDFSTEIGKYIWINKLLNTKNDGYFISGYSNEFSSNRNDDSLLIDIYNNGTIRWKKGFGGDNDDQVLDAIDDGTGYILGGFTNSLEFFKNIASIHKIDYDGNRIWEKVVDLGNIKTEGIALSLAPNGDIVLIGNTLTGILFIKTENNNSTNCSFKEINSDFYNIDSLKYDNIEVEHSIKNISIKSNSIGLSKINNSLNHTNFCFENNYIDISNTNSSEWIPYDLNLSSSEYPINNTFDYDTNYKNKNFIDGIKDNYITIIYGASIGIGISLIGTLILYLLCRIKKCFDFKKSLKNKKSNNYRQVTQEIQNNNNIENQSDDSNDDVLGENIQNSTNNDIENSEEIIQYVM